MTHSTVLIPLVLLLGATVPCLADEGSKQNFTCTAKAFNDCLMEAPCSAWTSSEVIPWKAKRFRAVRWGMSSKRNAEKSRFSCV